MRSWVIDFDKFSGKAQVRRAMLSCDSSYISKVLLTMGLQTLQAMQNIYLTISAVSYSFLICFNSLFSEKQLDNFILFNRNLALNFHFENRGYGLYRKMMIFKTSTLHCKDKFIIQLPLILNFPLS